MRRVHRLLAFGVAAPLVWIAGTGILLGIATALRDSREPWRVPRAALAGPATQPGTAAQARLRETLAVVEREGEGARLRGVVLAESPGSSDRVLLEGGETWFYVPATQAVFARVRRSESEGDWIETLTWLHRGRFFGPRGTPGRTFFSAMGLAALALAVSGVPLFRRTARLRTARDWHRLAGVGLAAPLAVLVLTGAIWNFSEELRGAPPPAPSGHSAPGAMDWLEAARRAAAANPDGELEALYLRKGRFLVVFRDSARISLAASGATAPTELSRPWTWRGWFEPMLRVHSGRIWGAQGVWVTITTGLVTLLVAGTGVKLLFRSRR